ncbi:hypothetical protein GCM10010216_20990 [Streptomyces flaveolus]|nr:hypothetical protein GCM10010216_20990 [Streptomyces flaveolus]
MTLSDLSREVLEFCAEVLGHEGGRKVGQVGHRPMPTMNVLAAGLKKDGDTTNPEPELKLPATSGGAGRAAPEREASPVRAR